MNYIRIGNYIQLVSGNVKIDFAQSPRLYQGKITIKYILVSDYITCAFTRDQPFTNQG